MFIAFFNVNSVFLVEFWEDNVNLLLTYKTIYRFLHPLSR